LSHNREEIRFLSFNFPYILTKIKVTLASFIDWLFFRWNEVLFIETYLLKLTRLDECSIVIAWLRVSIQPKDVDILHELQLSAWKILIQNLIFPHFITKNWLILCYWRSYNRRTIKRVYCVCSGWIRLKIIREK
jgi:hypothetical protein